MQVIDRAFSFSAMGKNILFEREVICEPQSLRFVVSSIHLEEKGLLRGGTENLIRRKDGS